MKEETRLKLKHRSPPGSKHCPCFARRSTKSCAQHSVAPVPYQAEAAPGLFAEKTHVFAHRRGQRGRRSETWACNRRTGASAKIKMLH